MGFSSKTDAVNNMNSNITSPTEPHLTPTGGDNKVRASNLKQWLVDFLDWITPVSGSDLKRKSPVVTATGTDYSTISWIEIIPVGTIMPWAGASLTPPDGYLFCDGVLKSTATYPDLSAILGVNYNNGSVPGGQFRVPNLEGRVPLGFDASAPTTPTSDPDYSTTNNGKVGNRGGEQSVYLGTSNLPAHSHTNGSLSAVSTGSDHKHFFSGSGDGNIDNTSNGKGVWKQNNDRPGTYTGGMTDSGSHVHGIIGSVASTGGNVRHENRMPYLVLKYIIKT